MGTWAYRVSDCNSYCKYMIFGVHLVGNIIHILSKFWTDWTTKQVCTLKLKLLHASKQPCCKYQFSDCNSYCRCMIFGTHLENNIIHILSNEWTDWTTKRVCTLKLKLHASKQPCSKYFSYSAHSLHIYIPTDSDF